MLLDVTKCYLMLLDVTRCYLMLPDVIKMAVRPDAYLAKQLMLRRICEVGGKEEAVFSWRHFDYITKDRKGDRR